jgi:hypothetical protein
MTQPSSGQNAGEPTQASSEPIGGDTASHASYAPVPAPQQRTWNDTMRQLDGYAEKARVALPAAPPGLLDGYMRFFPWIAIVLGVLGVLVFLLPLIIGTALSPLFLLLGGPSGVSAGGGLLFALVVAIIGSALEVVAGYMMLKRRVTGWWLMAFGLVLSLLTNLFGRSILSVILVILIAYIHLQVKPNYH